MSYNFEEEEALVAVFVSGALLVVLVYSLLLWHSEHVESGPVPHLSYFATSPLENDPEIVNIDLKS